MVVPREPLNLYTVFAPITFHSESLELKIFRGWCRVTIGLHIFVGTTLSALRLVTPLEKVMLKPFE
jgi:hypothetical protein